MQSYNQAVQQFVAQTAAGRDAEARRLLDRLTLEISRELHYEVGQSLGALLVDIGRLSTALSGDQPEVKPQPGNLKSVAERIPVT